MGYRNHFIEAVLALTLTACGTNTVGARAPLPKCVDISDDSMLHVNTHDFVFTPGEPPIEIHVSPNLSQLGHTDQDQCILVATTQVSDADGKVVNILTLRVPGEARSYPSQHLCDDTPDYLKPPSNSLDCYDIVNGIPVNVDVGTANNPRIVTITLGPDSSGNQAIIPDDLEAYLARLKANLNRQFPGTPISVISTHSPIILNDDYRRGISSSVPETVPPLTPSLQLAPIDQVTPIELPHNVPPSGKIKLAINPRPNQKLTYFTIKKDTPLQNILTNLLKLPVPNPQETLNTTKQITKRVSLKWLPWSDDPEAAKHTTTGHPLLLTNVQFVKANNAEVLAIGQTPSTQETVFVTLGKDIPIKITSTAIDNQEDVVEKTSRLLTMFVVGGVKNFNIAPQGSAYEPSADPTQLVDNIRAYQPESTVYFEDSSGSFTSINLPTGTQVEFLGLFYSPIGQAFVIGRVNTSLNFPGVNLTTDETKQYLERIQIATGNNGSAITIYVPLQDIIQPY